MNRKEFLEILRSQLAGQMQEGKAAAHIRYYEDYIQSQVRGGRSEQEVLQELGDPHLIAKTLIDTDDGSTQEDYGECPYSSACSLSPREKYRQSGLRFISWEHTYSMMPSNQKEPDILAARANTSVW